MPLFSMFRALGLVNSLPGLYATDQGLTFAGMAIVIVPPLLLFLVLQRSFIQGLTAGIVRHR